MVRVRANVTLVVAEPASDDPPASSGKSERLAGMYLDRALFFFFTILLDLGRWMGKNSIVRPPHY